MAPTRHDRSLVRKDAETTSARRLTSLLRRFERIVESEFLPMGFVEGHESDDIGFGLIVFQRGELLKARPQLIGDMAPRLLSSLGVGFLGEDGANGGGRPS